MKRVSDYPDTYEKLVKLVMKQHPGWTQADAERFIAANNDPNPLPRRQEET